MVRHIHIFFYRYRVTVFYLVLASYFASMVIYPLIKSGFDWNHTQLVWKEWQTFNAGIIALLSSVIAYFVLEVSADKQRERNFSAAKAFLPEALSELSRYCKSYGPILAELSEHFRGPAGTEALLPIKKFKLPDQPENYREVFRNCIRYSDPHVGQLLSNLLSSIQIHRSRLREFAAQEERGEAEFRMTIFNYRQCAYDTGEIMAMVGMLFPFSRNLEAAPSANLTIDELINAFNLINMTLIDDQELREYALKRLSK